MPVMASFTSKMELHYFTNTLSAANSKSMSQRSIGCTTADQALLRGPPRSPDLTLYDFYRDTSTFSPSLSTASTTESELRTDHGCRLRNRSIDDDMLHGNERKLIIGLRVDKLGMQTKLEFLFPSVGGVLQSVPPFKCTHFKNGIRELCITKTSKYAALRW
jgi:hypothetical protein